MRLPRCERPALACHLGVTLDRGEAHPEQASGLAIVRAPRESFYYLSAQIFGVGFHGAMMPSGPTSSQDAVEKEPGGIYGASLLTRLLRAVTVSAKISRGRITRQ
jgi:hypothetical protein